MDRSKHKVSSRRSTCLELELKIELGRSRIDRRDLCGLSVGSVVSLDTSVSDPVDITANGRLVARGEVLVLHGKLCVRITELVGDGVRMADAAA